MYVYERLDDHVGMPVCIYVNIHMYGRMYMYMYMYMYFICI